MCVYIFSCSNVNKLIIMYICKRIIYCLWKFPNFYWILSVSLSPSIYQSIYLSLNLSKLDRQTSDIPLILPLIQLTPFPSNQRPSTCVSLPFPSLHLASHFVFLPAKCVTFTHLPDNTNLHASGARDLQEKVEPTQADEGGTQLHRSHGLLGKTTECTEKRGERGRFGSRGGRGRGGRGGGEG